MDKHGQVEITRKLESSLAAFLSHWGPVQWQHLKTRDYAPDEVLSHVFWALSNIEDDSLAVRRKLRLSRADRLQPIEDFNIVWLAEEAEHARVFAHLARCYGPGFERLQHGILKRDRRSILAAGSLSAAGAYASGMLAAYLTLGTMQEYIALTAYNTIAERFVDDEAVSKVLHAIAAQEGRHMRFYRSGAEAVLAEYPIARRFVRQIAQSFWRPPGVDLLGPPRWKQVFAPVFADDEFRARILHVDDILRNIVGGTAPVMRQYMSSAGL